MQDKISKILAHYGDEHQIDKLAEELMELSLAILRRKSRGMANVLEEYADCKVMMTQLDKILTDREHLIVQCEMERKTDRELNRIEDAAIKRGADKALYEIDLMVQEGSDKMQEHIEKSNVKMATEMKLRSDIGYPLTDVPPPKVNCDTCAHLDILSMVCKVDKGYEPEGKLCWDYAKRDCKR